MKRRPNPRTPAEVKAYGRRVARIALKDRSDWRHVWTRQLPDGTVHVVRGDRCIASLKWQDLRTRLTPDDYRLIGALFELLVEQSEVASLAAVVAGAEAASASGREKGRETAQADAALAPKVEAEIRALLARGWPRSDRGIARLVHERIRGAPPVETLRRKVAELRKNTG